MVPCGTPSRTPEPEDEEEETREEEEARIYLSEKLEMSRTLEVSLDTTDRIGEPDRSRNSRLWANGVFMIQHCSSKTARVNPTREPGF